MAPDPPPVSLLSGVDWKVVGYAFGMGTLMSILITLRARAQPLPPGQTRPGWATLIPDTLLGGIIGVIFALGGPELFRALRSFLGVTILAGVGGILGPKLTDWVSLNGLDTLLDFAGGGADRFSKAISRRRAAQGEGDDENQSPPKST